MTELKHVGIKGMRWGFRKSESSGSKPNYSPSTKKKVREMSDDELKKVTARLQLEKQYKDLTKKELSAGQKYIGSILANSGKVVLSAAAVYGMKKGLAWALKEAIRLKYQYGA